MIRIIPISLVSATLLLANSATLSTINVNAAYDYENTKKSLDSEDLKVTKQSDLATMLSETLPEINHVRNSAVGSDIQIRGLERDNLSVKIDGCGIFGGCPNRMDPPAMHVSSSQIESVVLIKGPYDVKNFGALGASIDVKTKNPTVSPSGEISLTAGSNSYKKGSLSASGGNEKVQVLFGYSKETSDQYKDGDGRTMVEQVDRLLRSTVPAENANKYKAGYKDAKAYERENIWAKINFNIDDKQSLLLSYFGDSADNVLYPAFAMDAQIDETDAYSIEYKAKNLSSFSNELSVKYYNSKVAHEMGTEFRNSGTGATFRTHKVDSKIDGLILSNSDDIGVFDVEYGIDTSKRNWNGVCLSEPSRAFRQTRIPDVDTKNRAIFAKAEHSIDKLDMEYGIRLDRTKIDANKSLVVNSANPNPVKTYYNTADTSKKYNNTSVYAMGTYNISDYTNIFLALGQSYRVPDAKELYFINYAGAPTNAWMMQGNDKLKATQNRQVDLGIETKVTDMSTLKATTFYSQLDDYIYSYKNGPTTTFANIDAKIYGFDASFLQNFTDELYLKASLAYQRGKKRTLEQANGDKDLAGITPLKTILTLGYDASNYYVQASLINGSKQKNIDSLNGEQNISGYHVVNLKAGYEFNKKVSINGGIDNLFDKTYAVNNTYLGRNTISGDGSAPLLLNESGRNVYLNLTYKF